MKTKDQLKNDIKLYRSISEKAKKNEEILNKQEIEARNNACKQSPVMSIREGWIWDICWNAAREYYLIKRGEIQARNHADKHVPEED